MKIQYQNVKFLDLITHTAWGIAVHQWLYLLWKNRFRVSFRSLPKVLLITCNAILNAPLQIFEYYRYRRAIRDTEVKDPVFIIGHYRSGTTHLHYLLSKDPKFAWCSTYEGLTPNTFLSIGRISRAFMAWVMPPTRPQDNVKSAATLPLEEEFAMGNMSSTSFVHGYYFPQSITKVFLETVLFEDAKAETVSKWKRSFLFLVKKIALRYRGKRILLKSPANTARIKEILELFPTARFIHVHRNPYDVYQSTVHLYEKILPVLGFQKADDTRMEEFVLFAYERLYKKFLLEKTLIPPGQLIEFPYDHLIDAPAQTLHQIYDALGLGSFDEISPFMKNEIVEAREYAKNSYSPLTPEAKERITRRWLFAFDAFKYPT